jgi:hypothetical protein
MLLGLASAFLRMAQVSQAKVFPVDDPFCALIIILSLPRRRGPDDIVAGAYSDDLRLL